MEVVATTERGEREQPPANQILTESKIARNIYCVYVCVCVCVCVCVLFECILCRVGGIEHIRNMGIMSGVYNQNKKRLYGAEGSGYNCCLEVHIEQPLFLHIDTAHSHYTSSKLQCYNTIHHT